MSPVNEQERRGISMLFVTFCYLLNSQTKKIFDPYYETVTGSLLQFKIRKTYNQFIDAPYLSHIQEEWKYTIVELMKSISQVNRKLRELCNQRLNVICSIGSRLSLVSGVIGRNEYSLFQKSLLVMYQNIQNDPNGLWLYIPPDMKGLYGLINSKRTFGETGHYNSNVVYIRPIQILGLMASVYSPSLRYSSKRHTCSEHFLFEWLMLSDVTVRNNRLFSELSGSRTSRWTPWHYHQFFDSQGILLDHVDDRNKLLFLPLEMMYNSLRLFDIYKGINGLVCPPGKQNICNLLETGGKKRKGDSENKKLQRVTRHMISRFCTNIVSKLFIPGYSIRLFNSGYNGSVSQMNSNDDKARFGELTSDTDPVTVMYSGSRQISWNKIEDWKIRQSLNFILSTLFGSQDFLSWPEKLCIVADTRRLNDTILWESWTQARLLCISNPFLTAIQNSKQLLEIYDNFTNHPLESMMIERKLTFPETPEVYFHCYDRWKTSLEVVYYMNEQQMVCLRPQCDSIGQFLCPVTWLKAFCRSNAEESEDICKLDSKQMTDEIRVGDSIEWFEPYPPHISRRTQVQYGYDLTKCSAEEKWSRPLSIETIELGHWEQIKLNSTNSRTSNACGDLYSLKERGPQQQHQQKKLDRRTKQQDLSNELIFSKTYSHPVSLFDVINFSPLNRNSIKRQYFNYSNCVKEMRKMMDISDEDAQMDIVNYEYQWMKDYSSGSNLPKYFIEIVEYNAKRYQSDNWVLSKGNVCYFCLQDSKIVAATIEVFTNSKKLVVKWDLNRDVRSIGQMLFAGGSGSMSGGGRSDVKYLHRINVNKKMVCTKTLNQLILPIEAIENILFLPNGYERYKQQFLDYLATLYNGTFLHTEY